MKRSFCGIGGGFLTGAFLSSFTSVQTQAIFIIACVFVFILLLIFHKGKTKTGLCVFVATCLLGTASYSLKTIYQYQPVVNYAGTSATVTAEVKEVTRRPNGKYSYLMKTQELRSDDTQQTEKISFQFLLYSEDLSIQEQEVVRLPAEFYLPVSNDGFDSLRYYQGKGIYLLAYVHTDTLQKDSQPELSTMVEILSQREPTIIDHFKQLNQTIAAQAEQRLSPDAAAIFQGMLLGNRDFIRYPLQQQYTNAGIVHLLAISGLHVAVISGLLGVLLRRFPAWLRFSLQSTVLIAFILFSGMQVSAIRSGIMILLLSVGQLFRRRSDGMNSLFFAGLLIAGFDPFAVTDLSFCMSFLATLGVLLFVEQSSEWFLKISHPFVQKILQLIGITVSANLFLFPIYLYNFKTMSVVAPFANLAISLLTAPILGWGFLLCICAFLPLPQLFWQIEDWMIGLQNFVAGCFGRLRFATIGLDYPEIRYWLFAALLLLGAAYLFRKHGKGMLKFAATLSAALFLCCNCVVILRNQHSVQIDFVGDGSTSNAVIYYNGHATVIAMTDDDYIDKRTLQYLKGKGVYLIDNLIIAYPNFSAYQDTLDFCQSIEVQNILYHKDNTACEMILNSYTNPQNILPIEPHLQSILIEGKLQITPVYGKTALNLFVDCFDNRFYLGTEAGTRTAENCSVFALTGQKRQFEQDFSNSIVLLLQRQFQLDEVPSNYYEANRQTISFRISQENGLESWLPKQSETKE